MKAEAVVVLAPPLLRRPRPFQRKNDCAAAEDVPLRVAQDLACALAGKKRRYGERVPERAKRPRGPGDGDDDDGDELEAVVAAAAAGGETAEGAKGMGLAPVEPWKTSAAS